MKTKLLTAALIAGALMPAAYTAIAQVFDPMATMRPVAMSSSEMKWMSGPPALPKGAMFSVLQGDPSKEGMFIIRAKMPAGYVVPPHWHPTDENVTVISGTLIVGMGDEIVRGDATQLTAGGFITAPANMHHYAVAVGKTVVQVHGTGPFAITYVKAKDDPQTASR